MPKSEKSAKSKSPKSKSPKDKREKSEKGDKTDAEQNPLPPLERRRPIDYVDWPETTNFRLPSLPSILDIPLDPPNIYDYNAERSVNVNHVYQLRMEARNQVPRMSKPGEGEFVPEYLPHLNQKMLDQYIDDLPAAKIPSKFMETLVGFISFYDSRTRIYYRQYQLKSDYSLVLSMIDKLDYEHYPKETFRYYLQNWPDLCIIAFNEEHKPIGVIIAQRIGRTHGYIAYTFVERPYRRKKVGSHLVKVLHNRMHKIGIREVTTEVDTENRNGLLFFFLMMGFIKERHLMYYYRNGWNAWRMKMWIYTYNLDYDRYPREVFEKIQYLKTHVPTEEEKAASAAVTGSNKKSPKSKEKSPKSGKKSKK